MLSLHSPTPGAVYAKEGSVLHTEMVPFQANVKQEEKGERGNDYQAGIKGTEVADSPHHHQAIKDAVQRYSTALPKTGVANQINDSSSRGTIADSNREQRTRQRRRSTTLEPKVLESPDAIPRRRGSNVQHTNAATNVRANRRRKQPGRLAVRRQHLKGIGNSGKIHRPGSASERSLIERFPFKQRRKLASTSSPAVRPPNVDTLEDLPDHYLQSLVDVGFGNKISVAERRVITPA